MKVVYLGIILTFLLVAMSYAKPIHAESSNPVQILNVQVQPNIIKVNDTFSVNMMILNNSPFPIYLTSGSCTPAFSVVFDAHAKQVYPNIACTAEAILQRVDPQSQVTISNANKPGVIYQAVQSGTATVNITLPYYAKNQTATDYSDIYYNASKSILFTIYDNDTNSPVITKEELNKKLDAAREKISNIMMNNTTDIPFNMVGINIVNSTLEVGIDSTKATLSAEQYKEKIKEIVGDLPITLVMGHIQLLGNSTSEQKDSSTSFVMSPLKQFKSGIKPEYVKCNNNLHLIIKAEDGSFACVTIEAGKNLAMRGWATTFGTGISTNDYYTKCDTPYPQSNTGVAVFYMPTNSIGKICVRYHNLNNTPTGIGMRIFEANNLTQNASNVTSWMDSSTLEGNANKTIVYFIKTGTNTGFYGMSINCGGFPLAVRYDTNSTITASDFPWIGRAFHCGVITYDSHIEGTSGIDVKYIPYP
jgi:hypothetical protein